MKCADCLAERIVGDDLTDWWQHGFSAVTVVDGRAVCPEHAARRLDCLLHHPEAEETR